VFTAIGDQIKELVNVSKDTSRAPEERNNAILKAQVRYIETSPVKDNGTGGNAQSATDALRGVDTDIPVSAALQAWRETPAPPRRIVWDPALPPAEQARFTPADRAAGARLAPEQVEQRITYNVSMPQVEKDKFTPEDVARGWRVESRLKTNYDVAQSQAQGYRRPNPSEME